MSKYTTLIGVLVAVKKGELKLEDVPEQFKTDGVIRAAEEFKELYAKLVTANESRIVEMAHEFINAIKETHSENIHSFIDLLAQEEIKQDVTEDSSTVSNNASQAGIVYIDQTAFINDTKYVEEFVPDVSVVTEPVIVKEGHQDSTDQ